MFEKENSPRLDEYLLMDHSQSFKKNERFQHRQLLCHLSYCRDLGTIGHKHPSHLMSQWFYFQYEVCESLVAGETEVRSSLRFL